MFPSPHSGILFLCPKYSEGTAQERLFPSPHSGILFLWGKIRCYRLERWCFRPLIRGFFFYLCLMPKTARQRLFPSPHSGILFLCPDGTETIVSVSVMVSVPSFGDSFFILQVGKPYTLLKPFVSVPSFGDSFFILSL